MFHWQTFSSQAELKYNSNSIKNFPSISPIFSSTEFTGDELFRQEKSSSSTGKN
jgi:hypothetical protein